MIVAPPRRTLETPDGELITTLAQDPLQPGTAGGPARRDGAGITVNAPRLPETAGPVRGTAPAPILSASKAAQAAAPAKAPTWAMPAAIALGVLALLLLVLPVTRRRRGRA